MTDKTPTSIRQLVDELRVMGCERRHVMPHSSYRAIRPVENGPQGVVDARGRKDLLTMTNIIMVGLGGRILGMEPTDTIG